MHKRVAEIYLIGAFSFYMILCLTGHLFLFYLCFHLASKGSTFATVALMGKITGLRVLANVARILVHAGFAAHHQQFILAYPRTVGLEYFVEYGQFDLCATVIQRDDRHAPASRLLDAQPSDNARQHDWHAAPRRLPRSVTCAFGLPDELRRKVA